MRWLFDVLCVLLGWTLNGIVSLLLLFASSWPGRKWLNGLPKIKNTHMLSLPDTFLPPAFLDPCAADVWWAQNIFHEVKRPTTASFCIFSPSLIWCEACELPTVDISCTNFSTVLTPLLSSLTTIKPHREHFLHTHQTDADAINSKAWMSEALLAFSIELGPA